MAGFCLGAASSDVQALRDAGLPDALQLDLDSSESIQAAMAELLHKTDGRLDALLTTVHMVKLAQLKI